MLLKCLLAFIISFPALAMSEMTSSIYDIDYGVDANSETLVLLNSGKVLKIPSQKSFLMNELEEAKSNNETKIFHYDKDRFIVKIEDAKAPAISKDLQLFSPVHDPNYVPTTVPDMATAKKYFKQARYYAKDSQCFNRAMIWSYEWWKKNSVKSMKVLIYFTRTYIRRYNFEWWFHIAPYLHIMDEGKVVERVMDIKYSSGPRSMKQWTDIFMNKDPECPFISKFSDYADNPYIGDCYLQRTTMFTYQPADLQMYEAWNYTKTSFLMREVKQAYLEAFDENL